MRSFFNTLSLHFFPFILSLGILFLTPPLSQAFNHTHFIFEEGSPHPSSFEATTVSVEVTSEKIMLSTKPDKNGLKIDRDLTSINKENGYSIDLKASSYEEYEKVFTPTHITALIAQADFSELRYVAQTDQREDQAFKAVSALRDHKKFNELFLIATVPFPQTRSAHHAITALKKNGASNLLIRVATDDAATPENCLFALEALEDLYKGPSEITLQKVTAHDSYAKEDLWNLAHNLCPLRRYHADLYALVQHRILDILERERWFDHFSTCDPALIVFYLEENSSIAERILQIYQTYTVQSSLWHLAHLRKNTKWGKIAKDFLDSQEKRHTT